MAMKVLPPLQRPALPLEELLEPADRRAPPAHVPEAANGPLVTCE
jgi:hypothetical protein